MDDARLVRVLKALADPHRFKMLREIAGAGELSCGEIGERFPLAQPTISHHLKILIDAGLVVARREAQRGYMSIDREVLDRALALLPSRLEGRKAKPVARKKKTRP